MDVDFREGIAEPINEPSHNYSKKVNGDDIDNDLDINVKDNSNSNKTKQKGKEAQLTDEGKESDMEDIVDYMDTRHRATEDNINHNNDTNYYNKTPTNKQKTGMGVTDAKTPIKNGKSKTVKKNISIDYTTHNNNALKTISPLNTQEKKKNLISRNRPQSSMEVSNKKNYATTNEKKSEKKSSKKSTMPIVEEGIYKNAMFKSKRNDDPKYNKTIDYFENPEFEMKSNKKASAIIFKAKTAKKETGISSYYHQEKTSYTAHKKTIITPKIKQPINHYEEEKLTKGNTIKPTTKKFETISDQPSGGGTFEKNQDWDRKRKEKIEAQKLEKMKDVMKYNQNKPKINKKSAKMVNKSMDHGSDDYSTFNRLYNGGAKIKETRKMLEEKYAPSFKPKTNKLNTTTVHAKKNVVMENMETNVELERDSMHDLIRNKILKRARHTSLE